MKLHDRANVAGWFRKILITLWAFLTSYALINIGLTSLILLMVLGIVFPFMFVTPGIHFYFEEEAGTWVDFRNPIRVIEHVGATYDMVV